MNKKKWLTIGALVLAITVVGLSSCSAAATSTGGTNSSPRSLGWDSTIEL